MAIIVPTILATNMQDYAQRLARVKPFATRLHIDVADGVFTSTRTVPVSQVYDVQNVPLDLHLMLENPALQLDTIIALKPSLVIIHAESSTDHRWLARTVRAAGIRVGLAVLGTTSLASVAPLLPDFQHVLVFAGHLGRNGGTFDTAALTTIREVRRQWPKVEIGVDGGLNQQTAPTAAQAGADVLYVGSYLQEATNPQATYRELVASLAV